MKRIVLWGAGILVLFLAAGAVGFFALAPTYFAKSSNQISNYALPAVSPDAQALHDSLFIADMHADPLLWNRDLLERGSYGHVDVPRLIEGNVALQVFSTVTKVPWGQNYESNPSDSDAITTLILAQRWPAQTWGSLLNRALYQARKLEDVAARSNGAFRIIGTSDELVEYTLARSSESGVTAGMLGVEGAQCLEGKIENLDYLFAAGFRVVGLAHFFDNEVAGSAHGEEKGGLTDFGREVVEKCERYGMIIDLAHSSPATYQDVLAMATRPVIVSHGGVRATCDTVRNLSDDVLMQIRDNGGVVGIGYWKAAICDATPEGWVKAVQHAVNMMGIEHVGLGSDYDGATTVPFDTSHLAVLTDTLLNNGFSEDDVRLIMGGNVLRLLMQGLPKNFEDRSTDNAPVQ